MTLLTLLAVLLAWVNPASAQEFRRITASDGRVLLARVDATTADGLTLTLPQGSVRLPFSLVLNIENIDEPTWRGQPAWDVLVLPFRGDPSLAPDAAAATRDALAFLPAVRVLAPDRLASRLSAEDQAALAACGGVMDCALPLATKAGLTAVIAGEIYAGAPAHIALRGAFTATPTVRGDGEADVVASPWDQPRDLLTGAALSLLVVPAPATLGAVPEKLPRPTGPAVASGPGETQAGQITPTKPEKAPRPEKAPKPEKAPRPEKAPKPETAPPAPVATLSASRLRALAWVPLPGTPSLARKDWVGAAASWGLTVPVSAALVYGAGSATMTRGELIGLGALGCYTTTVASNLIFGLRHGGPGLSAGVTPTAGGATLSIAVPLR